LKYNLVAMHTQFMKNAKAMTIRLSQDQAEALETIAAVDSMAVSDVIRTAIEKHINARAAQDDFQLGLQERLERTQKLLRRPH
jgi:predicted transcriptional regulator